MMKKIMQRLLQMTAVIALIVVVGVSMTACGGNDDSTKTNPIDQLQGLYARDSLVYYFNGNEYYYTKLEVSEEKENGLRTVKFIDEGEGTIDWQGNKNYSSIYRTPNDTFYKRAEFIDCTRMENSNLATGFVTEAAGNHAGALRNYECGTYSKISSLRDFAEQVFSPSDGYFIDPEDTSAAYGVWIDLFLAA